MSAWCEDVRGQSEVRVIEVGRGGEVGEERDTVRYVGRAEAARTSRLGFELGGRVETVRVEEGDVVSEGEVLAEMDVARLGVRRRELEAGLVEAQAGVRLADSTFRRVSALAKSDVAAAQELDEARQAKDAAQAVVDRIRAQVDAVDVDLAKSELRAPFGGFVARRSVDEGAVVTAGEPVLELVEGRVEVRVGLPGSVAQSLKLGSTLDSEAHGPMVVERILPRRDLRTRTVDVILRPSKEGLRDGDLVSLKIPAAADDAGFLVPRTALTESIRGTWACYVAVTNGDSSVATLERRHLEVLEVAGEMVRVRGALREGDRLVADGLQRLVPGMEVRLTGGELADAGGGQ